MKIIQAPNTYEKQSHEIACFLAGGCQSTSWSETVLNTIQERPYNSLVIYNPYNPEIKNVKEQIEWEYNYLNKYINDHFIFSVYFDKHTDQPMSMYELGRASVLCKPNYVSIRTADLLNDNSSNYYINYGFPMVVSVHPEAPKKEDIMYQCMLVDIPVHERTPVEHAEEICWYYRDIRQHLK